ncbi:MAG: hypothetical protein U0X93_08280 [Anaerolineales bacterium]
MRYVWAVDRHRFAVHRSPDAFKAGPASNSAAYFGTQGELYDATAHLLESVDAFASTLLMVRSFGLIMLTLSYSVFFNPGLTGARRCMGSARGATDYKRNFAATWLGRWLSLPRWELFFLRVAKTIG